MAELTHGIDDFRPTNIFKIAYDADWLNASLDLGDKGTGLQSIGDGYSGGYMFLRYLAKQAALQSVAEELQSYTNSLLITLTANADTYSNALASATIQALAGNDTITNTGASVSIDGGAGNDTFYSNGASVSIDAGDGADTIFSNGSNVTINAGAGKDTIDNRANLKSLIDGGADEDFIKSTAASSTIIGGTGNDTISNNKGGSNSSIVGGEGNDSIKNISYNSGVTIAGGDGTDTIENAGLNAQIIGGKDNDLISISGSNNLIQYTVGDGNDSIIGFNATSTLKIGNGTANDTYSKATVGADILVSVGGEVVTLSGAASLSSVTILGKEVTTVNPKLITLTEGNDTYSNSIVSAIIQALDGNDTI